MHDFSQYLIATDLDGTFFADHSKLVPRNLDAIQRFREGGGLFTFATARVNLSIYRRIPQPDALLSAPAVMCNGAYLYDFSTNTPYLEEFIPEDSTRKILSFIKAKFPDVAFRVAAPNVLRIENTNDPLIAKDVLGSPDECIRIAPAESWRMDDWYKIVFRADPARITAIREPLKQHLGDTLSVVPSHPEILEIQLPGTTKATGIEKLRRFIDDDRCTVISCGDFENDIPMHRASDIAVAPANALPSVKAICDHVFCSNNEGVIADVIEAIEAGVILPRR